MADLNKLIDLCRQGDRDALGEIVNLYSSRCYGYFYRLTGNRDLSDELLSELFVRLVQKISSFDGGSFESWLFRVASNLFRDHLRRQYRQQRLLEEKAQTMEQEENEKAAIDGEILDHLQDGLKILDSETAELIMLRFYGDLSFKELAEMRAEPIGTTLSKVHRGLKKIRAFLESKNERK